MNTSSPYNTCDVATWVSNQFLFLAFSQVAFGLILKIRPQIYTMKYNIRWWRGRKASHDIKQTSHALSAALRLVQSLESCHRVWCTRSQHFQPIEGRELSTFIVYSTEGKEWWCATKSQQSPCHHIRLQHCNLPELVQGKLNSRRNHQSTWEVR